MACRIAHIFPLPANAGSQPKGKAKKVQLPTLCKSNRQIHIFV
jgi:hypothetical protein